jgi:prepilin-type processing-associated H-X9-DG protein
MKSPTRSGRGFSITEILVVIGVIVVLLGLLVPALAGIRRSGLMAKSMANMRQVGTWMRLYSQDNRDFVVPSRFNYREDGYPGKVRSETHPVLGQKYRGTWADILWTVFEIGVFPEAAGTLQHDYRYDSPDGLFYGQAVSGSPGENYGRGFDNPLRSAAANSRNTYTSSANLATPYGAGASEAGLPGYFAANNFFNADAEATHPLTGAPLDNANWYTNGQIRTPERSMYVVDSFAGETIEPETAPYQVAESGFSGGGGSTPPYQVDFRYSGQCLMLFLDGHVEPVGEWDEICDLEGCGGRGIRIRALTARTLTAGECPPCP